MNDGRLVAWKTFGPDEEFAGLVFARNAFEAARQVPAGHSVYVGGPSPDEPDRPWWVEAWQAGTVEPDDLMANDPRTADE